jgi:hypothetical protein
MSSIYSVLDGIKELNTTKIPHTFDFRTVVFVIVSIVVQIIWQYGMVISRFP